MIKFRYLFLATIAAFASMACQPPAANTTNSNTAINTNANAAKPAAAAPTKEELMTLERSAWEAFKTKNAAFWDPFLSANFVGYGATGRIDRAAAIKEYAGAECDVKSFSLSDEQMIPIGPDAAVVSYKVTMDGTCAGQKLPAEQWAGGVYVRENDRWKGAFHASTPIIDPKAPPQPKSAPPASAKGEEAKPDASTENLLAIEKKLWEAWKNKDGSTLESILGKDFVWLSGTGRMNRAESVKAWSADNKCEIKSTTLTDAKAVSLNKDVSLLTFKGAADGTCEGQPVPTELYGAVYYNNNGTWQPVMGIGVPQ
jgi:hypothetical protein